MAAKIFVFLALLALSVSDTTAFFSSPCSPLPPIGLPPVCANPILQPYSRQQAIGQVTVANVGAYSQQQQLLPVNPLALANPLAAAFLQPQLALGNPLAAAFLQPQLALGNPLAAAFLQPQLALANPLAAAFLQPQLALANPLTASLLQPQLALANPLTTALLQPQLALANPLAAVLLQSQLLPFNQMTLMNPALSWRQPFAGGAIF